MPIFPSSRDEVVSRYLENLTSRTSINQITPGSKARSIGESTGREIELLSQLEEANFNKCFLATSYGQFLTRIVGAFGIRKRPARNAEVLATDRVVKVFTENGVTFGSLNNNESFTIPAGTIFSAPADVSLEVDAMFLGINSPNTSTDRSIHYSVTQAVTCVPTATEAYASVRCLVGGTQGNLAAPNMLVDHSFTGYAEYLRNKLKVTNTKPILNGVDEESDSSMKYRGSKIITSAEGSNSTAIGEKILEIPGVVDYVIIPYEDGVGRFNVYLKSITSTVSDKMLQEAQLILDSIQATGVVGFARRPMEIGVEIKSNLVYRNNYSEEEKALIRENLNFAAISYINSLDIGQALILSELARELKGIDQRVAGVGTNLKTLFDHVFVHYPARLTNSGKRREKLIQGSINAAPHARIIVENNVSVAIQFI